VEPPPPPSRRSVLFASSYLAPWSSFPGNRHSHPMCSQRASFVLIDIICSSIHYRFRFCSHHIPYVPLIGRRRAKSITTPRFIIWNRNPVLPIHYRVPGISCVNNSSIIISLFNAPYFRSSTRMPTPHALFILRDAKMRTHSFNAVGSRTTSPSVKVIKSYSRNLSIFLLYYTPKISLPIFWSAI
jgi:hypothetical protein